MPHTSSYCVNHCVNFMYSSLAHALSSYMVRSAWTCLIALQLPVLETGAAVFIDDLLEKDLNRPLWKGYSEAAEVKNTAKMHIKWCQVSPS